MLQLSEQSDPKTLIILNKKLAFQINETEKRAAELVIANHELAFQNGEKEKRVDHRQ
jgi:hypothetical protein